MLWAVHKVLTPVILFLCSRAANSLRFNESRLMLLPCAGTVIAEAVVTEILVNAVRVGEPPGLLTRIADKVEPGQAMKYPSVAAGSSLSTPCGVRIVAPRLPNVVPLNVPAIKFALFITEPS